MRRTLVTGLAAGALLLAGAGTALATDGDTPPATGPDTTACQDATAAAEQAHADLDAAVAAALAVDDVDEADLTAAEVTRLELVVEGGGEFVDVANAKLAVIRPAVDARDAADEADQAKTTACTAPADSAGQGDEQPQPGDECSTDVIASGVIGQSGECVGNVRDDADCADLTGDQAQAILDADPADPNRLDADGDGVACEVEGDTGAGDTSGSSTSTGGQVTTIPVGSADTGDGSSLR